MRTIRRVSVSCGILMLLSACSGDDTEPTSMDATVTEDAGPVGMDAASMDAEPMDAASMDAEPLDAAELDAGMPDSGGVGQTVFLLNHEFPCNTTPRPLVPSAGEEGYFTSVRLTPPVYPVEIDRIAITWINGDTAGSYNCGFDPPVRRFELYVASTNVPPSNPTAVRSVNWDENAGAGPVDPPLRLESGDQLFVSIPLSVTGTVSACPGFCDGSPSDSNRNFWSNAAQPPFNWVELSSFNLTNNLDIFARGRIVE